MNPQLIKKKVEDINITISSAGADESTIKEKVRYSYKKISSI